MRSPPITDAKADLWLVGVDGGTVRFARAYRGCVELIDDVSKQSWDALVHDVIGDDT